MEELAPLAMRRYPGVPLVLAVMYYASDRRAAGLGALDERKRNPKSEVSNTKRIDQLHRRIVYRREIIHPARYVYPEFDPLEYGPGSMQDTIQMTRLPEVKRAIAIQFDPWELRDQRGRTIAAHKLRDMRRKL